MAVRQRLFAEFDKDRDGLLTGAELRSCLHALGIAASNPTYAPTCPAGGGTSSTRSGDMWVEGGRYS